MDFIYSRTNHININCVYENESYQYGLRLFENESSHFCLHLFENESSHLLLHLFENESSHFCLHLIENESYQYGLHLFENESIIPLWIAVFENESIIPLWISFIRERIIPIRISFIRERINQSHYGLHLGRQPFFATKVSGADAPLLFSNIVFRNAFMGEICGAFGQRVAVVDRLASPPARGSSFSSPFISIIADSPLSSSH
ncbi:hypothetical protein CEXT_811871 [Caerostris extrusa]|uniref:Maturase K n=1 Tax=Caerostris extrusa TaxID=172846 RepID=A0AAV4MMG7_CAEEX|nr:hypothetical protein CEXT_811871 [Caerostris extrusa]